MLANEQGTAWLLWQRTGEPMRYALWAAHLAHSKALIAKNETLRSEWHAAAEMYEQWAFEVLNCEEDSEEAIKQLTFADQTISKTRCALDDAIVQDGEARRLRGQP